MPARVTIYCRCPVGAVTARDLRRELDSADLMTLAEALDLPEGEVAAVRAMKPHLRVEGEAGRFDVHWKPPGGRPLQIRTVAGDAAAAEAAELVREGLPRPRTTQARAVCERLRACREIVDIEMGLDDSNHLGATLAEVLAFFFAERGDGLVFFYGREFASPDDRGRALWTIARARS